MCIYVHNVLMHHVMSNDPRGILLLSYISNFKPHVGLLLPASVKSSSTVQCSSAVHSARTAVYSTCTYKENDVSRRCMRMK